MIFVVATLIVLFIAVLVAFLSENNKKKRLKSLLKEKNKKSSKLQKIFDAVFKNIHAYILVVDNGLNVMQTNYFHRNHKKDDGEVKRIGDMLCCHNAILSGKCGMHEKCRECLINSTVTESFNLKQSFPEMRVSLVINTSPDEFQEMEAVISGAYMRLEKEERMVITIHDVTEIVASKREAEKLANVVTLTSAMSRVGFAYLNLITCEETITPEYKINLNERKNKLTRDIFDSFHYVYPEYREDLLSYIATARDGKVEPLQKEVKVLTGENTFKWIKIFLIQKEYHPERNQNDIYSLTIDVTAQKDIENELAAEKVKAVEGDRSKSAFLANMSHEIRTPLNAIVGFSELLASATTAEEKEQYLEILKTNNDMLLQLVNDILDISKIEAGTLEFNMGDVDINALLSDIHQFYNLQLQENSEVRIICEPDRPDLTMFTDRNRIFQVLSNFLSNAIKFTEIGTIRFGYKLYDNNKVYFYVTDTGMGIEKDVVEHVFDRFARFHKEKKGNGLGLSISKTIIERLGGTIGVESVYRKGSTFWFILPLIVQEKLEDTKLSATAKSHESNIKRASGNSVSLSGSSAETNQDRPVILIAESDDEIYNSMNESLAPKYRVIRGFTGEEAIMIYLQNQPSLILMALQLPDVDGSQATEAIRHMSKTIPIIALSDEEQENKDEIMRSGFTGFMAKPLSKVSLVNMVDSYIR